MKLHFFPVAPNPTKVRLYLAEKCAGGAELDVQEELVDLRSGGQSSPEHLARNPFGRLPVLELDDGTHLIESLVIMEYLEELYPAPCLIGRDARERARVRELERIADLGALLPIALIVHATNSPLGLPPNPGMAEFYRGRLPAALRFLDEALADGRPFLAGEHPTLADCTLAAAFQFGRFGKLDLGPAYANLARWDRAYRERPAAQTVLNV